MKRLLHTRTWREVLAAPRSMRSLLAILIVVILVPVLAVQSLLIYRQYQARLQTEDEANLEAARSVAAIFESFVHDVALQEGALAETMATFGPQDLAHFQKVLEVQARKYQSIQNLALVDLQGKSIAFSDPRYALDISDRPYFHQAIRAAKDTWVVSDLLENKIAGGPIFTISSPVYTDDRVTAVVVAAINPDELAEHLFPAQRRNDGTALVFDRRGSVIVRLPPAKFSWEQRQTAYQADQALQKALAGQAATGRVVGIDGVRRMVARVPIPSLGWVAGAGMAQDQVTAPFWREVRNTAGANVLVLGLSSVGAILISRLVTRGVNRLHDRVEALGRDEEGPAPEQPTGIVELTRLADAFEKMAKRRRLAERDLREAKDRIVAVLESIRDGFFTIDRDWHFTYVNESGGRMLGMQPSAMVGKNLWELFPSAVGTTVSYRQYGVAMSERRRIDFEEYYPPLDTWFEVHVYPTAEGISVFFTDASQRKKAQQELQRTADELLRSNQDLEQFAYVASHDLQEPLRMVAGYVELLERRYGDKLDADAHTFIAYSVDGAKRMQRLINDLLAYSRVGTRGKDFKSVPMQLSLERALADLSVKIQETGATITHDPLPSVWGDETQLTQLLLNLIANALKFQAPGRAPAVHIGVQVQDEQWLLSVRDNGIGIDPRYARKIFLIFQRLHGRAKFEGSGIGLAICKKIVESHGGRIWVESQEGQGATFYFTLPQHA